MAFYELYAGSPENSRREILTHADLLTAEQLREWWGTALHDAGRVYRAKNRADLQHIADSLPEHADWAREALDMDRGAKVEDVFTEAVDLLCERHGFARLLIAAECSDFGAWAECYPEHKPF